MTQVLDTVLGPLQFDLTRRALIEVTLVGVACGALGVLVVLRRLSFIGDALGHCVVPGVVVAYLVRGPLEIFGGVAAVASSWGIAWLTRSARMRGDAAIAVVFTTSFAFGLALISTTRSYVTDLTEILFGNVLGVDATDIALSTGAAAIVLVTLAVLFRPLLLVAFDANAARAMGLPVGHLDRTLYALIALSIVSGAVAAGSLLVTALLIVPPAAARLLASSVRSQMVIAAGLGCLSGWIGLYASFYWPLASGGAVVVAAVALFGVSALAAFARAR